MGRIGSGVRVSVSFQQNTRRVLSYDVLRQQKTGVMTKGVDLRLRRITSSPSQTLRRRLVRTTNDGRRGECSARRRPSRLYFSHFATRIYGLQHCRSVCSVCSDIRSESRFCLPHMHSTPPNEGVECRWGRQKNVQTHRHRMTA